MQHVAATLQQDTYDVQGEPPPSTLFTHGIDHPDAFDRHTAAQGHEPARKARVKKLAKKMTLAQLDEAQWLAREWKPKSE